MQQPVAAAHLHVMVTLQSLVCLVCLTQSEEAGKLKERSNQATVVAARTLSELGKVIHSMGECPLHEKNRKNFTNRRDPEKKRKDHAAQRGPRQAHESPNLLTMSCNANK